jgi:membrane-associated protease RseP (regulator of RpoE activity)
MTGQILSMALAVSMLAAQKSATDCFTYFPMGGDSFGYSSDEGGGGSSYLGVDTRNLTQDRLSELKLKDDNGVEVTMVDQDAPAGKAGIKERDVIVSVNGSNVQSVEQLRRMIREIPSGRVVTLGLIRDGRPLTLKAQLADRKTAFTVVPDVKIKPFKFEMPNVQVLQDMDIPASVVVVHSSARSGLMVENLTPQLGTYFGAKDGQGILVRSVEKGSLAEKAGFRAGDVIVKVDNEGISDTGDFTHTLRMKRDDTKETTITVGIIRDRKEQTLSLTLPERKRSEMREESLDVPDINAQVKSELDQARVHVAELRPEMMQYAEQIKRLKPEMEKMAQEVKDQQEEIQKNLRQEMENLQEELHDQQQEYQELIHQTGGGADI